MLRRTTGEKIFDLCNATFLIVLMMITLYPFIYVVFASISDPAQIIKNTGILWRPVGFTLEAYKLVLTNPMIAIGYTNTLFIVLIGTVLNVLVTAIFAYVLSRKNVYWKNTMMFLVIFTLFFSGGLIPEYILVKNLGMLDTRWSLIFPGLIATWNLIIMRTSFMSVPYELEESARIDGAGDITIFFRVIIPLQTSVIAVMFLFYGVSHWNAWANAMIFLKDRELFPLQLVLREILIVNETGNMTTEVTSSQDHALSAILKYATIIVATLPILVVYPLIQRHFTKGVMIGALKG
jgi:putative aldouronate transport system permease protein